MKPESITLTIRVQGTRQDGNDTSITVSQELLLSDYAPTPRDKIIDFLQRTAAAAYERAIKEED